MQKLYTSCSSVSEVITSARNAPLKAMRFMYNEETNDAILKNIQLDIYQTGKVNIIDYNARGAPLSLLLNQQLKPKHHLVYPDGKSAFKFWERMIGTGELVNLHVTDPPIANTLKANTLSKPLKMNWLEPRFLTAEELQTKEYGPGKSPINETLLFIADFTSTANAGSLRTALYYNEVTTCMFRYSGVKFLAWSKPTEVLKYLTGVGTMHRRTNSLMASLYSDVRLIACSETISNDKARRMIDGIKETNHVVSLKEPFSKDEYCLIEFQSNHNKYKINYPDELHLCIHKLFSAPGAMVKDVLHTLGPGAADYLSTKISNEVLVKKVSHVTNQEFVDISEAFWGWPFKPDINLDLFNDQEHFNEED